MPRVPYLADERAARAEAANKPLVVIDRATKTMRLERPGKTALLTVAAQPVSIVPATEMPPVKTGFTRKQQAAIYFARKHRRQRLGVLPGPNPANWVDAWAVNGVAPSVALDFTAGQYYDGASNAALASSLVNGTLSISSAGLQCGALNLTTKGALTSALQAANCTVYIEVSGGAAATTAGVLSFTSGSPDTPCIADGGLNSFDTFAASLSGVGPATGLTGVQKIATGWGAASSKSTIAVGGGVGEINVNMAAVTGPILGSYAGAYPWAGQIRKLGVWPTKLATGDLQSLSISGIPFAKQGGVSTMPTGYIYSPSSPDVANALRDYFSNSHPWTMLCEFTSAALNSTGLVLWTTVHNGGQPWFGQETWVPGQSDHTGFAGGAGTGAMRTHLMCGWDGSTTTKSVQVNGTKNVLDGAKHLVASSYDGSGVAAGCKFWVDGLPDAVSAVDHNSLTASSAPPADGQFEVGGQFGAYTVQVMTFFAIWKVVQNDAWHAAAKVTRPPPDANTLVYYDFKEGSGTTTTDRSGNGWTGFFHAPVSWI